jgi:hypothetical protein
MVEQSPDTAHDELQRAGGRMSASIMIRTAASATGSRGDEPVDDRGTPASRLGPSFSSMPQTGKLNALIWTATPCSDVQTCWPTKRAALSTAAPYAVDQNRWLAARAALDEKGEERARAALDVDPAVVAGRAGLVVSSYSSSLRAMIAGRAPCSMCARS